MNPIMVIAALFGAAGIMVIFVGIATARRASEGAEEVQNRLFQYGVGSAPAAAAPARTTPRSPREVIAGLFEPAAQRLGQGNVKRGKKPLAEQLQKADLKLRTSSCAGGRSRRSSSRWSGTSSPASTCATGWASGSRRSTTSWGTPWCCSRTRSKPVTPSRRPSTPWPRTRCRRCPTNSRARCAR